MTEIVKKPIGRRPKKPPKDAAQRIYTAAATGASQKSMAIALGCAHDTLQRWLDENQELRDALDAGRESERQTLHNRVFDIATNGEGRDSLLAAFFLLKSRHGYREGDQEAQANRVSINFQLPGAQPFDPSKVIDAADNRTQPLSAKPLGFTRTG